ncbi:hypothetical protein B5T_03549 [Alloalcanivorax dieselolei B5]|uniref:Uncharacterized protein n=1 Tax=Alcanivorax dieselolei (strain DSM 16502 / CGMCC 1.3690 / MCCC 1A00001 / B-5) TaxID=930169 RepID=K0CHI7_ALCDB|nr:hypothetical protein [Alloalcanivorax dieselolei]AFT71815.1 hypothetical protein B5T_03549 [Alloalcanivorax dieselolei B5]GGK02250.1 hypothetical protein GCM10007426_34160 [Alloalcanivorax dieselolei]
MAVITYTAKRSLMDGHVAGQSYEFEVLLSDWTPDSDPETSSSTSLSGRKFTTLHRIEKSFSAQTIPVDLFPADAGINRAATRHSRYSFSVPRTCGEQEVNFLSFDRV